MKANEFIKKVGWDGTKRVIGLTIGNSWADHYSIEDDSIGTAGTIYSKKLCERNDNFVCLRSLKHLIESHELVESYGGVKNATFFTHSGFDYAEQLRLRQAILDVESCKA